MNLHTQISYELQGVWWTIFAFFGGLFIFRFVVNCLRSKSTAKERPELPRSEFRRRFGVSLAEPEDVPNFLDWSRKTQGPEWTPEASQFPSALTFKAVDKDGKPIVFLPVYRPAMLHAFAIKPGTSRLSVAAAVKALLFKTAKTAEQAGCGEMYFWGAEKTMQDFAERWGFEKIELPVYRMPLAKMKKVFKDY